MFIKQWCCFFCLLQYDLILVDVEGWVVLFCFFPNDSGANSHDCCHVKHHLWSWLGCAMFQIAQCMSNSSDCGNVLLFRGALCTRHISLRTFLKAVSWINRAKAISLTRFEGNTLNMFIVTDHELLKIRIIYELLASNYWVCNFNHINIVY